MKDIRGKYAIVTGASRGLGVHIARRLAEEGVHLALTARSADALEETRRICEAAGVRAIAVPCDISSIEDQRRLVATAEREFGSIDILVNNAGIELGEEFRYLSTNQLDSVLTTNLNAPIWLTKLVLPSMLSRRSGAIVYVSSLAGKSPTPYNAIYAASKAGLIGLGTSLGIELEGTGVHVGVVMPGFVSDAGMWAIHESDGAKMSRMMRATTPAKVADGVVKAIRGRNEVIVSPGPIKPLLALAELAPGRKPAMTRRLGIKKTFGQIVDATRVGEERDGAAQASGRTSAGVGGGD